MTDPRTRLAVAEFLDSPRGRALGARPELVRRAAELIVTSAVEHLGVAPRELDGEQLKELLLGVVPRRLGAKDPAATVVPAVARAFFSHLAEHELVPHAFELELALDEVDEGYDAAVRGVRPEERIAGATETLRNRAAPLGRNDPCPCGSGKKWKKCCGKAGP